MEESSLYGEVCFGSFASLDRERGRGRGEFHAVARRDVLPLCKYEEFRGQKHDNPRNVTFSQKKKKNKRKRRRDNS